MHNGFGSGYGHYGNWLCWPGNFFPGPLGWIISILFWGLVIYLVVKLFQALFSGKKTAPDSRLDVLKERYARGEIDEAEYQRMRSEIV